jgi:VIT1/CCC1 family predicted Fe2+/Mn2+ transporter
LEALIIGEVELFSLGFVKAMLIGLDMFNKFFNAFEMLLLGAVAVAVGYGIGKAFPNSG